jgi:hypothetical protein
MDMTWNGLKDMRWHDGRSIQDLINMLENRGTEKKVLDAIEHVTEAILEDLLNMPWAHHSQKHLLCPLWTLSRANL